MNAVSRAALVAVMAMVVGCGSGDQTNDDHQTKYEVPGPDIQATGSGGIQGYGDDLADVEHLSLAWAQLGSNWDLVTVDGTPIGWRNIVPGGAMSFDLYAPLTGLPDGAVVRDFGIAWMGGQGHSAMPAELPAVKLERVGFGEAPVTLAEAHEENVTPGAYEQVHAIGVSAVNVPIDRRSGSYVVVVKGERGAGSTDGGVMLGAWVRLAD